MKCAWRLLLIVLLSAGSGWAQFASSPVESVAAIAVVPQAPATVVAGTSHGIYISRNGGASWEGALRDQNVFGFAIDSATPSTLYAVGDDQVLKSANSGLSWTSIATIRGANVVAVDSNPLNPAVYVGTSGGPDVSGINGSLYKSTDG